MNFVVSKFGGLHEQRVKKLGGPHEKGLGSEASQFYIRTVGTVVDTKVYYEQYGRRLIISTENYMEKTGVPSYTCNTIPIIEKEKTSVEKLRM
jgi:hypothetical protein